jgi:hypothetical protein
MDAFHPIATAVAIIAAATEVDGVDLREWAIAVECLSWPTSTPMAPRHHTGHHPRETIEGGCSGLFVQRRPAGIECHAHVTKSRQTR